MTVTIEFKDIVRMMNTGESFRLYSARVEVTDPDRINKLWQQISEQINHHGTPASTCCFMLKAGDQLGVTMDEIAELCDLIQQAYKEGDIVWGFDDVSNDGSLSLEVIG